MAPTAPRHTPTRTDPTPRRAAAPSDHLPGASDETAPDHVAHLEEQVHGLSQALHNRDVIGQAKGILIAHYAMDADAAFAVLVRLSQHTNIKLAEIATVLVTRVRDHGPAAPPHQHCRRCRSLSVAVHALLETPLGKGQG